MKIETKTVQIAPESLALYWGAECELESLDGEYVPNEKDELVPGPGAKWNKARTDVERALFPFTEIRNIRPILKDPEDMSFDVRFSIGDKYIGIDSEMDRVYNAQGIARWIFDAIALGYDLGGYDTEGNWHPSLIKAGLAIEAEPLTTATTQHRGISPNYPGSKKEV